MAAITLGMTFQSSEEAEAAVDAFAQETYSPLRKRSCVTVDFYNKKVSAARQLDADIKYQRLHWECKHFGKHIQRGVGKRAITHTYAKECPMQITITYNRSLGQFKVSQLVLNHENHAVGKDVFQMYPDARRPSGDAAEAMDAMLAVGENASLVTESMHQKGYAIRKKDVYNRKRAIVAAANNILKRMVSCSGYEFQTLRVISPSEYVYHVEINKPEKRNEMNKAFWREIVVCFNKISSDGNCRCVVVSSAGKIFSAGMDLQLHCDEVCNGDEMDVAHDAFSVQRFIPVLQESFTVIEKCSKPIIAAVHNGCIGGGVDLICACDIRYCSQDAWFQVKSLVKEVAFGIVADVGTLQRLPKIVGSDSLARELCYTARQLKSDEALKVGLVSRVLLDKNATVAAALETAKLIASQCPVTVQGTKIALVYARDHSVSVGVEQVQLTGNQVMLQTEDIVS